MKTETVHLPIVKYFTPAGKHTCAVNIMEGHFCPFLLSVGWKGLDTCSRAEARDKSGAKYKGLVDREIGSDGHPFGFTIPHPLCPLKNLKETKTTDGCKERKRR